MYMGVIKRLMDIYVWGGGGPRVCQSSKGSTQILPLLRGGAGAP